VSAPIHLDVADIDRDGDPDVASASQNIEPVVYFDNDGTPDVGNWLSNSIGMSPANARYILAERFIPGDSIDVYALNANDDIYYRNLGGIPASFDLGDDLSVAVQDSESLIAFDTGFYNSLDIIAAVPSTNVVYQLTNNSGFGSVSLATSLVTDKVLAPLCVFAADTNNDGEPDIIIGSDECPDMHPTCLGELIIAINQGDGIMWTEQPVDNSLDRVESVWGGDLDLDGDTDMLIANNPAGTQGDRVAWYESAGISGSSFTPHNVSSNTFFTRIPNAVDPRHVAAADMDRDGDPDVVIASQGDDTVAWYPNLGGQAALTAENDVVTTVLLRGVETSVMKINVEHRGRLGDNAVELARLDFRLQENPMTPLSSEEANALFNGLSVYRDMGSGDWEPDQDDLLAATSGPFNLSNGSFSLPFPDDNPDNAATVNNEMVLFATLGVNAFAPNMPETFQLVMTTAGEGQTEDKVFDLPLDLSYSPAFTTLLLSIDETSLSLPDGYILR
jgi:hypothetical protein